MELLNKNIVSKKTDKIKIMQFGEGNFLRAFVDWIVDEMNKKANFNAGVVVVQPMPFGRCKELQEADGLYTLYLQGLNNGQVVKQHQVIDCLEECGTKMEAFEINPSMIYAYQRDFKQLMIFGIKCPF